ncbi:DNA replication/repair protein RecF [Caulobacter sp. S45]|uniref:DNA replication/repair protein RecF n=1 Tax=Caulobacter sp. S45 TaxID=1641861 RepID=UPI0015761234|nr:DNA replication/repair protein RecF [Caulobacter sp. S45]
MARTILRRLALRDFRSYHDAALELDGRPVALSGLNGAGKTNLLEAVSYLAPGKGLRGASVAELGRRTPGEPSGRAWSLATVLEDGKGETRVGTGTDSVAASRRLVRLDGETVAPGRLAGVVRLVWLTPAQDRLFLDGATERRRFLDRLTFAAEPAHAAVANAYDRALRERLRLLTDGPADAAWLSALEVRLGAEGVRLADARARTLDVLQAEIDRRVDRPFPLALLDLVGDWSRPDPAADAPRLAEAFARARARDAVAGRSLTGPHRTDLLVRHREKDRPAAECSTGEQKALILNLVLAQAARLSRAESSPNPILLLDEVAAHLDVKRRAALFEEITALGLQAFLTGTDRALFQHRPGWAQEVLVDASQLKPLAD